MPSSIGLKIEWEYPRTDPPAETPTYVALANVVDANAPDITKETSKEMYLDQANRYMTKIAGWVDGGQPTLKLKFAKGDYVKLKAAAEDDGAYRFKITIPDHKTVGNRSTYAVPALVVGLGLPFDAGGDRMICDVKLDVSGKPEFTAGSDS